MGVIKEPLPDNSGFLWMDDSVPVAERGRKAAEVLEVVPDPDDPPARTRPRRVPLAERVAELERQLAELTGQSPTIQSPTPEPPGQTPEKTRGKR